MKKTHCAMVKFKVALAALTGQPIIEICKQYEVAESLVHKWKNCLKDNGTIVFEQGVKKQMDDYESEKAKLYQRIGQLSTELEFLKKVVKA